MVNTVTQSTLPFASPVLFSTKPKWKPVHTDEEKHKYAVKSGKGWVTQTINSAQELYEHIRKGHPIAPVFEKGKRQQANFQSAQLLLLDFDEIANLGIDRAMSIPFIRDYAAILYETPKSTPEKPRLRVVFICEKPITDAGEYENLLKRLLLHLEVTYDFYADWSTANAAQFFFGSDKPNPVVRDRILPEWLIPPINYSLEQIKFLRSQRLKDAQSFKGGDFTPTSSAQVLAQALDTTPASASDQHAAPTVQAKTPLSSDWQFIPEQINVILKVLDVTFFHESGFGDAYCPFHKDDKMSAGWNRDKHFLLCKACRKKYLAIEVAAKLGLPLQSVRLNPDGSLYSPPNDGLLHLPNSVRECFLKHQITHVPRLLDLLYMNGFQADEVFCASTILPLCEKHGINRKALGEALKQVVKGQAIFVPHQSSDSTHPDNLENFCTVDSGGSQSLSIQTSHDVNVQKGTEIAKRKRGRPSQYYRLPSVNDLCGWLDVLPSRSDRLEPTDLRSPARYRSALNRALFERRPQAYSQKWLANRLGVKAVSTLYRQFKEMEENDGLVKTPQFHERSITFKNLDTVPDDETAMTLNNLWLECEGSDKKYPPKRSVAVQRLKEGNKVRLMSRRTNLYEINRELAAQQQAEREKEEEGQPPQPDALSEVPLPSVMVMVTKQQSDGVDASIKSDTVRDVEGRYS
ncbi:MAG: hypothetical protein LCI00_05585 [Chloroflexi bacterium]|nr:hypothetical protein [Chloroflexota bacterium]